MEATRRKKWPKGTWMKLVSADRLRSFIGPEPGKKMSGRTLARYIDKHPSFIDHLLHGRKSTCTPQTAQRIAEALGVPVDVLFEPRVPSNTTSSAKQQARRIAA